MHHLHRPKCIEICAPLFPVHFAKRPFISLPSPLLSLSLLPLFFPLSFPLDSGAAVTRADGQHDSRWGRREARLAWHLMGPWVDEEDAGSGPPSPVVARIVGFEPDVVESGPSIAARAAIDNGDDRLRNG